MSSISVLREIINNFEVDDQCVPVKSKDLTSLFFIRNNLSYYRVSRVLFYTQICFSEAVLWGHYLQAEKQGKSYKKGVCVIIEEVIF